MRNDYPRNFLAFQIDRQLIMAAKAFLNIVESQRKDHDVMIAKIKASIPVEFHKVIDNCNYFTDSKYAFVRKQILDRNGDTKREIEGQLEKVTIEFDGNHNFNKR